MKRWMKGIAIASLLLAAGCGSSSSFASTASEPSFIEAPAGNAAMAAGTSDYAAESEYMMDEASDRKETSESGSEASAITGQKLVYTGSMTLETLNYEETAAAVRERIRSYKGIVEREDEWDGDHSWYYTDGRKRTANRTLSMTARIPTGSFDAFMNDMDGAGKVTSRSQNVENISRRYSDNSIEIESLQLQQERLLQMMEKAETVEDMIQIEERLSAVQTQLNQKKSLQSSMDTDVEYSTVYLNINEVQMYTPDVDPGIQIGGFGTRLLETLKSSAVHFVYFLQNLVLGLIRIAPYLLLAALVVFIWVKYRKSKGKSVNPFAVKKKEPQQKKETDLGNVKK